MECLQWFAEYPELFNEKYNVYGGRITSVGEMQIFAGFGILILLVIAGGCFMRCFGESYTIDYCGEKGCYKGAKDSYPAGTKVKLCYSLIATDTDYSFYLDGQPLQYEYDSAKGFIIQFVMPNHNVKLECVTKNSMVSTRECE